MAGSPAYRKLLDEAWDVHVRKNAGYAGADNPDPWANFRMSEAFGVSAVDGCLVRLSDKYIRVTNLRKDPTNDRVNESLRDTLQDLAAYALIAICLLDEETANASPETLQTAPSGTPPWLRADYEDGVCDPRVPCGLGDKCRCTETEHRMLDGDR